MALQYPLLIPCVKDRYRPILPHRDLNGMRAGEHDKLTMREYHAYRLQCRETEGHTLMSSSQLKQQCIVEAYMTIEDNIIWKLLWNYLRMLSISIIQAHLYNAIIPLQQLNKRKYLKLSTFKLQIKKTNIK